MIYENFYKVYNPKAADRLGVVYTPNEIVKFMIEGADWLTQKHFGKSLIDKDVEILDPATGTGTFICELLEHFRGQPQKLANKYKEELHANEVAILPYYVANLNIEATYAAISKKFVEFPNLCFVDTLDNVAGLGIRSGHQHDMFAGLSDENVERVKRQNKRKISVIIGNPPYNANQANENDNNKNREHERIDQRIKQTYIKNSTAQKTKVYDMYARFFRWASDRIHDDGIIVFITNRGFLDKRNYDGFRKSVHDEFNQIYVVDLGGDWRATGIGGGGNVFGIGTGVAISFMIKKKLSKGSTKANALYYGHLDTERADDKLAKLASVSLDKFNFVQIEPDVQNYWINHVEQEFGNELLLASKAIKSRKAGQQSKAIFERFALGVSTNRDAWVYDLSDTLLWNKASFLDAKYRSQKKGAAYDATIKWSRNLKRRKLSGQTEELSKTDIRDAEYRPFVKKRLLDSQLYIDEGGVRALAYRLQSSPKSICITDPFSQKPWLTRSVDTLPDLHFVGSGAGTIAFPFVWCNDQGEKIENVTDWSLKQFQTHYKTNPSRPVRGRAPEGKGITKDDIFNYVYGVLHDPISREKYAINLKREFPRIPFYPDFQQWAEWGAKLMAIHIGYEQVKPWDLQRVDVATSATPIPKLKADKGNGSIMLDSATQLSGIPASAWEYRLGNRSGLEWILDQYKEKKPKDPTIREKFNTYRFANYKEKVIDLLARVTRVSVETMEIVEAMKLAKRDWAGLAGQARQWRG